MKRLSATLYLLSKYFRFIPFTLLGICFLEIFAYDSNPFSNYKMVISGLKEITGFGLLGNFILLYYFMILKHCWHSIVAMIGLMLLNIINIITMLLINIESLGLSEKERQFMISRYNSFGTAFDYVIIFITFILAALLLVRNEIFKRDEKHASNFSRHIR